MGKLLCEKNLRDVWCRNEGVRAEIGQILHTHTHTHASPIVVTMCIHRSLCKGQRIQNGKLCREALAKKNRLPTDVYYMYFIY